MKHLKLAVVAIALLMPYSAKAGSMLDGGAFGMISLAGNVTISPSFGYYPSVRGEFGVGRFLIAGSVGGVFAGETPDQVVAVDGAAKLIDFSMPFDKSGEGMCFLYLMGGVSSAQGTYSLIVDGSQYRIGPKLFLDFDAKSANPNKVSLYFAMPFMTAKVVNSPDDITLENVKYLAFEGGISIGL